MLRDRLIFAGIGYVALVVLAVATIFWLRFRLGKIEEQVRTTRPQIDAIAMDKARWLALAPAIDPQRYPLEILWQVCAGLSSDDIRLTKFNATDNSVFDRGRSADGKRGRRLWRTTEKKSRAE